MKNFTQSVQLILYILHVKYNEIYLFFIYLFEKSRFFFDSNFKKLHFIKNSH